MRKHIPTDAQYQPKQRSQPFFSCGYGYFAHTSSSISFSSSWRGFEAWCNQIHVHWGFQCCAGRGPCVSAQRSCTATLARKAAWTTSFQWFQPVLAICNGLRNSKPAATRHGRIGSLSLRSFELHAQPCRSSRRWFQRTSCNPRSDKGLHFQWFYERNERNCTQQRKAKSQRGVERI